MTTTTFRADSTNREVNWNDPARWSGGVVPNSPTVDVIIPRITVNGSGIPYPSTITVDDTYTVSSLSLAHNSLYLHFGGNLTVVHNLNIFDRGEIILIGALSADSIDNNGLQIQAAGTITTTGLFLNETTFVGHGLNLTAGSLTNTGTLFGGNFTVTVTPGGFTNLSGSTLSGGTYRAAGDLYLNVGSVIDTDAADIQIDAGGAIHSYDDVSHAYVSLASSLHSIAGSGKLFLGHQPYNWSNLTVDGSLTVSTATLNTTGLTVDSGGKVFGIGVIGGPIVNNGMIVAGSIDDVLVNNEVKDNDALSISGTITGSGTIEIAQARVVTSSTGIATYVPVSLELAGAVSSNVVFGDGRGTLKLDDYAEFTGKIRPVATGDTIILKGVAYSSVTGYAYSGDSHQGTLAIQTAGDEIDLQFLGNFDTASFQLIAGPQPLSSDPASLQIGVGLAPAGSISISDISITEGNSGTVVETFTVTRSGGTSAFGVNFATADNTATTADHDYVANAGTLNFGVGVNTKTISVTINGDTKLENSETFHVNLSGATNGAVMSDNSALGTIANDEGTRSPHEFNGDGNNDFLWRNDSGAVATWDMNDRSSSGASIASVSNDWHIADTGDFNGDGKSDFLWRNDDGSVATWNMNDRSYSGLVIGSASNDWHIAGTGDFNGDHKTDILWRNDSGAVATWNMNDRSANGAVIGSASNNWHIAGTGDFNGDGKTDILWRNDSGAVATWDMNDRIPNGAVIANVSNDWHIAGTGDFNGDGKTDILWRKDNGAVATWDMDDRNSNGAIIATVTNDWHIAETGDFNGDGKTDILWRNDNGSVATWDMNDRSYSGLVIATTPNDWHIV
jgi:hypothetical protein